VVVLGPLPALDLELARRSIDEHLWLPLGVARHAIDRITPSGSLLLMTGTAARRPALGLSLAALLAHPDDVAALAVRLMTNTAITGATYDIDGGQQVLPAQ
jgi:hypothetical protein